MTQAVSRRPLTTEDWVRSHSAHVTCGGQSDTVTAFSPNAFGFRLSLAFHQCSILIFIDMLLLSERKALETWESPNKVTGKSGNVGLKRPIPVAARSKA